MGSNRMIDAAIKMPGMLSERFEHEKRQEIKKTLYSRGLKI